MKLSQLRAAARVFRLTVEVERVDSKRRAFLKLPHDARWCVSLCRRVSAVLRLTDAGDSFTARTRRECIDKAAKRLRDRSRKAIAALDEVAA